MRNLIVNADDLGWTEGVSRGIAEAHRNGIVTSASLLANGAAFEAGVELARTMPALGVGVHLNLSDGEPVAPRELVTSLLNERGELEGRPESLLLRLARRSVSLEEVEREWDAQIQKVRDFEIQIQGAVFGLFGCERECELSIRVGQMFGFLKAATFG